jgi:hypothetical protein
MTEINSTNSTILVLGIAAGITSIIAAIKKNIIKCECGKFKCFQQTNQQPDIESQQIQQVANTILTGMVGSKKLINVVSPREETKKINTKKEEIKKEENINILDIKKIEEKKQLFDSKLKKSKSSFN